MSGEDQDIDGAGQHHGRQLDREIADIVARVMVEYHEAKGAKRGSPLSGPVVQVLAAGVVLGAFALFGKWVWEPNVTRMERTIDTLKSEIGCLRSDLGTWQQKVIAQIADHEARLTTSENLLWTTRGNPALPARRIPREAP